MFGLCHGPQISNLCVLNGGDHAPFPDSTVLGCAHVDAHQQIARAMALPQESDKTLGYFPVFSKVEQCFPSQSTCGEAG